MASGSGHRPGIVLDALCAAEDAEDAAEAMEEPGDSISLEELEVEFGLSAPIEG
jgi:hypothetical protein